MSIPCSGSSKSHKLQKKYKEFDQHKVVHVMQETHWDCGLACVAMILHGLDQQTSSKTLWRHCQVESIWTIDLAFLLVGYTTDFTFYTSWLGSRKEYQNEPFYQANFDQDEARVNRLFSSAKRSGVNVVRMVLPLEDYKRFLGENKFAVLVLVNAQLLNCLLCKNAVRGDGYVGHFVVLIGYDPTEDMFIYRDPATSDSYCVISSKELEQARQAEGTDHDCDPIAMIETEKTQKT